ncbi:MAG: hypothetical protein ACK4MD_10535 [Demequina sp.]
MVQRFVSARRRRSAVSVRMIALIGLIAIATALAFGSLHTTAPDAPVASGSIHAVADVSDSAQGCAHCGEHDQGAIAACLMMLVVAVLMAVRREAPISWQARIPPRAYQWAPRIVERPSTPRLEVLCICRT